MLRSSLTHTLNRRLSLRAGLLVFQFVISVLLIAGTFLIDRQITFMQNQSLGFDSEQMLVIQSPSDTTIKSGPLEAFKKELASLSFVEAVAAASSVPGNHISWRYSVGITEDDRKEGLLVSVDYYFLDTYDLQLVTGRSFSEHYTTDQDAFILPEIFTIRL